MNKPFLNTRILLIVMAMMVCSMSFARPTGSFNANIKFMGKSRELSLFVPGNYDSTKKYNLMICLHGLGDNCANFRNALVSYGWPINIPNTIFICPEVDTIVTDYYYPAGGEAIIQQCIDYGKGNYSIDTTDIILEGFSIGGRDALRYGLDHYAQFKGLLLNTPAIQGVKEALNIGLDKFIYNYANASKIPIYITHGETDIAYEGPIDSAFHELVINNGKTWYFEFPGLGHAIPPISKIKNCIPFFNAPATPGYNIDIQNLIVAPRICNTTYYYTAKAFIRNIGQATISSATFEYSVNNTPQTYTWNGTLLPFQYIIFSLPGINVSTGSQNFSLSLKIISLNGTKTDSDSVISSNRRTANMQVVTHGTSLPFLEGFDGPTVPPANWIAESGGDYWMPWFIDSTTYRYGSASMGAFNSALLFENVGRKSEISTPRLDLTTGILPLLKFDEAFNYVHYTANVLGVDTVFADTLQVLISTDCGETWTSIYKKGGKQLATFHNPILNPLQVQSYIIVPKDSNWRTEQIDLSPYKNADAAVIKFSYISAMGGSVYIDNLRIATYSGVEQAGNNAIFRIYPNPAKDIVNITTGNDNILKVNILDIAGKTVMNIPNETATGGTFSVNTASLSKGLYFFQVYTDKGVNTSKVVLE